MAAAVDAAAAKMAAVSVAPDSEAVFKAAVAAKAPYYAKRIELFEQYAARTKAAVEAARAANVAITVTMPDGKQRQAVKGVTTPLDIAKEVSASLAKKVVVADVDGAPWDLMRPLEGDCALKLFSFDDPEGKDVSGATGGWYARRSQAHLTPTPHEFHPLRRHSYR
jgi:threonyl-tRNA synthetase